MTLEELKETMRQLGNQRKEELDKYLDFSEFDQFREILGKKLPVGLVNQNSIKDLLSNFLFHTNIIGEISSRYGLNGLSPSKVDRITKEDFEKIQQIIEHMDKVKSLMKSLKSSPAHSFITYTQFSFGRKHLYSLLDELSEAFKKAFRLSKGDSDNRKTYYLALITASRNYNPVLLDIYHKVEPLQHWELFKLSSIFCVFLIKQGLLKKDYGTFKAEFWDVERGLRKNFTLIEPEFISRLERNKST